MTTNHNSNDVSLRDYMEAKFRNVEDKLDSQKEFNKLHFDLNEKAIKKAEDSMTTRLESMNEFRNQIKEERGNYATKEHISTLEKTIDNRIKPLETANAFTAGKLWVVMTIFAAIPTIIAIIAFIRTLTNNP